MGDGIGHNCFEDDEQTRKIKDLTRKIESLYSEEELVRIVTDYGYLARNYALLDKEEDEERKREYQSEIDMMKNKIEAEVPLHVRKIIENLPMREIQEKSEKYRTKKFE